MANGYTDGGTAGVSSKGAFLMQRMKKSGGLVLASVMLLVSPLILPGCSTIDAVGKENYGTFQTLHIPDKDFKTLGLVFSEVSFDTDLKGQRGDVFTYNALLKEAQKLGGDYIINVVIDVKREETAEFLFKKYKRNVLSGKETWYGSATVIKYTDSLINKGTQTTTTNANGVTTTATTSEEYLLGGAGSGSFAGTPSTAENPLLANKKVWWNPFTWFKK